MPSTPTYLIKTLLTPPSVSAEVKKTSKHFLLHCPRYENQRLKMLNTIRIILTDTPVTTVTERSLFGSEHISVDKKTRLCDAVFKFISESKR